MSETMNSYNGKKRPTGDYAIGYCKPPRHSQWQPGQSGNRAGRRPNKLTSDIDEAIQDALEIIVVVPFMGKRRRMTLAQTIANKHVLAAAGGNQPAVRDVIKNQRLRKAAHGEDMETVIEAELIFDNEPNRLVQMAKEIRVLQEQLKYANDRLNGQRSSDDPASSTDR